jgi:hypothetical protein
MGSRTSLVWVTAMLSIVLIPVLLLVSLYFAAAPVSDPKLQVRCGAAVEGRGTPLLALPDEQCHAIADAIPITGTATENAKVLASDDHKVKVAVGKPPPAYVEVKPLPEKVTGKYPTLRDYRYFVAGDDIALVDKSGEKVVAFVEVHLSPR